MIRTLDRLGKRAETDNRNGAIRHRADRRWDLALFLAMTPLFILPVALGVIVIAPDWSFWTDWKDPVYWPLLTAAGTVLGLGIGQYLGWQFFRLPMATVTAALTTLTVQVGMILAFHQFAGYPLSFSWTGTLIPMAILLDVVLVVTGSFSAGAGLAAFAYGALFYSANSVLMEPFLSPLVRGGKVLTVANLLGFEYHRSSVPEYLRLVQIGKLHSSADQVGLIAALFTGALCVATYFAGVGVGRFLVVRPLDRLLGAPSQSDSVSTSEGSRI